MINIETFLGKTFSDITITDDKEVIIFYGKNGPSYRMYHEQDCCEYVRLEEVIGDIKDLIGSPIVMAELATNQEEVNYDSRTWSFYKLATVKGYVTLRWCGESNGYYSERVDICEIDWAKEF